MKGLTAQDRLDWEKQYADQIKGYTPEQVDRVYKNFKFKEVFGGREDYDKLKSLAPELRDSLLSEEQFTLPLNIVLPDSTDFNLNLANQIKDTIEAAAPVKELTDRLYEEYTSYPGRSRKELDNFDKLAETISPHYKRYKNTEYLPFSEEEKLLIMADYNAAKEAYGEEEANTRLRIIMQDTASENQGTLEKYWNGFKGMGALTAGALIGAAGMIKGAIDYVGDESNPELNPLQDFLDHVIDNDWTRYGNDVMTYGSLFDANILYAKENGDISNIPIIRTTEEESGNILDNILSVNTIPELINQQGFTVASMLTGAGLSAISTKAFQGLRGAAIAANRAGALANALKLNTLLQGLLRALLATNAFIIPAAVGTVEGVTEGLNTKILFLDDAKALISQALTKAVEAEVNKRLLNPDQLIKDGYDPSSAEDILRLYDDIFKAYSPQYEEAVTRAEANAAKAGIYNMGLNSVINGALNMTLKAGLQTPSVLEALRRSRLGRIYNPSEFSVSKSGLVTPSYGKLKKITNVLQEPAGEFSEEYLLSVSDAFARGGAEYDLLLFIRNKYEGDGKDAIDNSIADNLWAAAKAAGDAAIDKETILSGIYGALASGLGTPTINNRRGPAIRMEDESKLDYALRRSPITYRNPIYEAIKELRELYEDRSTAASVITDWIQDPSNRSKYDGLVGTFNWAQLMDKSSADNDQFAYRNSELGKTINDVMMLELVKGTEYYNSFMNDLVRAANAEEGSPEAQGLVEQFKNQVSNRDLDLDDSEVLAVIKDNASKLLNTMSAIHNESNNLDRVLGNAVNQDTKQALIYGKLLMEDWRLRATALELDILIQVPSSVTSNYDEGSLSEFIKYGDIHKAKGEVSKYQDLIAKLRQDIKNIESRKNIAGDREKHILKSKKATIKTLEKEVDRLAKLELPKWGESFILSERDILSLNPVDRATILNPENANKYNEAQLEVISNIIREGISNDPDYLNKVQDAGRLNLALQAYLTLYNDILSSPESFNAYSNRIKQKTEIANTRRKYEYLGGILDYALFVKNLDKSFEGASILERNIIKDVLEGNPNYQRYVENNKNLLAIFDQLDTNEKFSELSDNDKNLLMASMQYITDKGTNVADDNVLEILSTVDDNGNSELFQYIRDVNSKLPKGNLMNIPVILDLIDLYDNVLREHEKNITDVERVNRPILPKPTTTLDSKPPSPVSVFKLVRENPGIVGTPEDGKPLDGLTPPTLKPKTEPKEEPKEEDPLVSKYALNSNDEIANAVYDMLNRIDKSSSVYNDVKALAVDVLDALGDSEYEDIDSLKEAIMRKANSILVLSLEGGDSFDKLSSLLKLIAAKTKSEPVKSEPKTITTDDSDERLRNNGLITTASVYNYPNSAVGQAYTNYGIDSFLKSNKINSKTPIMFLADPAVVNSVKLEMGDKYNEEDHLPIMAIVRDDNGPITIDNKKYQPIGFMPRTSAISQGAARTEFIRKLAINQLGKLLTDNKGKVIRTTGLVKARAPEHTEAGTPNTLILSIMLNDMPLQDKDIMNNTSIPEETRLSIYRKHRDHILKNIRRVTKGSKEEERIHLSYVTPNLKGGETEFELYVTTPLNTIARNGLPMPLVLLEGTPEEIISANSRLHRYSKTLEDIFKGNPFGLDIKFKRDNGVLVPVGEGVNKLNSIGDNITKKLSNSISLPKGYMYTVTPTEEVLDNRRLYLLSVTDGIENIPLGLVTDGAMTDNTKALIIKNLMLDGNNFRLNGNQPFAKWQVNYNDFVSKEGEDPKAKSARLSNIKQIFDDNILESSRTSLTYVIRNVNINSPNARFDVVPSTIVANQDNATLGKPINTPVIVATDLVASQGAIIDSENGTVLEGKQELTSTILLAKAIVNRIEQDSKSIRLDELGYVDENGIRYTRVTSIIQADEKAGERFDSNSPWVTPSTNIGTSVDEFVRDYFAGKLDETLESTGKEDKLYLYPNASHSSWVAFKQQLDKLKNYLDSKGLTVVPRDITVTGSINVTDNKGLTHSINVAGTLDLLAYDNQGNFHIFDMKTNRSGIDEHKREKYARLVSLYKKFLEDKYNVKVASLNIIPIKVEYATPKGAGNGTVEYTVSEGNQLLANGRLYRGANPTLQEVGTVPYIEPNIQYDKLTDSEKRMITESLPDNVTPDKVEIAEPEAKVDTNSGLKRTKIVNRFSKTPKKSNLVTPSSNNWDLLSQETKSRAIALGYTKESWNSMTEEEKRHQKECLE